MASYRVETFKYTKIHYVVVLKGQRYDIGRARWPGALPELQFYCTELDGVKRSEFILFQVAFGAVGMHTTYTTAL